MSALGELAEGRAQPVHFDRVAQHRPGGVRLDIAEFLRIDGSLPPGGLDDRRLGVWAWCGDPAGVTIVVDRDAANDRVDNKEFSYARTDGSLRKENLE